MGATIPSSVTDKARNQWPSGKLFGVRQTIAPPASGVLLTTLRTKSRLTASPTAETSANLASKRFQSSARNQPRSPLCVRGRAIRTNCQPGRRLRSEHADVVSGGKSSTTSRFSGWNGYRPGKGLAMKLRHSSTPMGTFPCTPAQRQNPVVHTTKCTHPTLTTLAFLNDFRGDQGLATVQKTSVTRPIGLPMGV